MISLEEYLKGLLEYEKKINFELQEILKKAETSFTYEDIKIKSFDYYDDENYCIKLLITKFNNYKNCIMEINCRDSLIDTLTYQKDLFSSTMIFEKVDLDNNVLQEIILLVEKYRDFYLNELSYENIMRNIRRVPKKLPFYDHPITNNERMILKGTMLEVDKIPHFLRESKSK